MISVPWFDKEDLKKNKIEIGKTSFLFRWTNEIINESNRYIGFEMDSGFSIYYTGFGIYHRQSKHDKLPFWNYASYQNSKFYNCLRSSIIRCISESKK